ncbi:LacI family DNA-binding transcriptional regulator [Pelagicoccus sp. SDUM812002]|uniref:LacI family DNA-binding transcriptional regulator n=1 Tax=Pelagicoccus sp. SDUM812002 TaxID=3041266 RepID=UPI00280DC105|nr:LacI family DNA-binding transcriptional regulator [Pelagicoccus sp. SDUM812002]MDQ8185044.1 LacI family DNA-binding transcriptional regulator [Pelagicoccus sp. SDUM812002]
MDKPRVLMKDVAKVAGVHQTTVSLALRNHPSLPQKTRDRIQKLANEMGYRPDPALSALVAYRQATKNQPSEQVIAWIINVKDDLRSSGLHVHRLLMEGAKERANELGYKLDIFWLGKEYKDSKSLNRVLKARGIQGVIFGAFDYHEEPFELDWDLFSCIKVNPLPEALPFDSVLCDQIDAVGQVVSELRRVGVERFGLAVSEFEEIHKRFTFAAGFHTHRRQIAPENWIPPFYFQHGAEYKEDVIPATLEWARENKLQALISNWNNIEVVARKLNEEGQDCRFISLDADETTARHGGIHQDHRENGRRAVDMAVGQIKTFRRGKETSPSTTLVAAKMMPIPEENPLKAELKSQAVLAS